MRDREGVAGLQDKRPGPKPQNDAKDKVLEQRDKQMAKLEKELRIAKALIELLVRAHEILDVALPGIEDAEMNALQRQSASAHRRPR